eukprot:COSAG04_NODE_69_length_29236_cov_15.813680_22_plen_158_part_00
MHEISAAQVGDLFPLCRTDDIEAGFYVEDDGRVNPVDATMALAKGARDYGATIIQGCEVTGVTKEAGRVTGVTTGCGSTIGAEYVVNCAGMWAREFGEICGVNIPNQAAEHYYLITEPMDAVSRHSYRWHLGCILLKMPAISLLTGRPGVARRRGPG